MNEHGSKNNLEQMDVKIPVQAMNLEIRTYNEEKIIYICKYSESILNKLAKHITDQSENKAEAS
jgi:hypothetical protein